MIERVLIHIFSFLVKKIQKYYKNITKILQKTCKRLVLMEGKMEELDLKQLVNIFWSKRLHVISIVLIFLIIGTVYTFLFVTPKYKSYTSLVLARSESTKASPS